MGLRAHAIARTAHITHTARCAAGNVNSVTPITIDRQLPANSPLRDQRPLGSTGDRRTQKNFKLKSVQLRNPTLTHASNYQHLCP
jgi:hypothetical protein